jgi:hypothetical protein
MKASPGKRPSTQCREGWLGPRSRMDLREEHKILNRKFYIFIIFFFIFLNVLLYWPSISCSGGFIFKGQGKVASPSTRLEHRQPGSPKHQQVSVLGLQTNVMNHEWRNVVTNCCDTFKWGILLLGCETVSLGRRFLTILRNVENHSTNDIASHPKSVDPEPPFSENLWSRIPKFSYYSYYSFLFYEFNGVPLSVEGVKSYDH